MGAVAPILGAVTSLASSAMAGGAPEAPSAPEVKPEPPEPAATADVAKEAKTKKEAQTGVKKQPLTGLRIARGGLGTSSGGSGLNV